MDDIYTNLHDVTSAPLALPSAVPTIPSLSSAPASPPVVPAPTVSFGGTSVRSLAANAQGTVRAFSKEPFSLPQTAIPASHILWGAAAAAAVGAFVAEAARRRAEEAEQRREANEGIRLRILGQLETKWAREAAALKQTSAPTKLEDEEITWLKRAVEQDKNLPVTNVVASPPVDSRLEDEEETWLKQAATKDKNPPVTTANNIGRPHDFPRSPEPLPKDLACDVSDYPPTTTIGPGLSTPSAPQPNAKDIFDASCEVADAIDPLSPNPEFVGTGLGWGELIDQAVTSMRQTPPTGNPVFEIARSITYFAEFVKNKLSTAYNVVCQQVNQEGVYYEAFPVDKKLSYAKDNMVRQWNDLTTTQKVIFVGVAVLTILIAIPLLL